jgi:ParB family chromosome partitioning protein
MELKHIDIAHLSVSPVNMRAKGKTLDIANILPSVRARGVLVPLIVRAKSCPELAEGGSPGSYEIVAASGAIMRRWRSRPRVARSNRCRARSWRRGTMRQRSKPR